MYIFIYKSLRPENNCATEIVHNIQAKAKIDRKPTQIKLKP